jgi:hypothetical protein
MLGVSAARSEAAVACEEEPQVARAHDVHEERRELVDIGDPDVTSAEGVDDVSCRRRGGRKVGRGLQLGSASTLCSPAVGAVRGFRIKEVMDGQSKGFRTPTWRGPNLVDLLDQHPARKR